MTLPTKTLTVTVEDQTGTAVANAIVQAYLTKPEIYNGVLVPDRQSTRADDSGAATLALFPNTLGKANSKYRVTARAPDDGRFLLDVTIEMPNIDSALADLIDAPPQDGAAIAWAAVESVQDVADAIQDSGDEAEASATAAAASAAAAATSEANAGTSEDNAAASATAAATSATNAAASEAAAAASETAAGTSEANAAASATAASTSETNAATSESNAAGSATAASASATAAASSETAAGTSEANAAASASAAATSEANASASETAAGTSETNASASETAAAASASAAADSETNAQDLYTDFLGVYYGALAADPTEDPNGNAINAGDWYFNTTDGRARIYDGSDWGYVSADQTAGSTQVTASGSTKARSLADRFSDEINVLDFGAVGDGSTDDTDAIQSALSAAAGKTLRIPKGQYLIDASTGTEILLWDKPARIVGDGAHDDGSVLLVKSTVAATIDVMRLAPDDLVTGEQLFFWSMTGVYIKAESGSPGRYGFFIDLPDSSAAFIAKFDFSKNWIGPLGSRAFAMTKAGTTINGFFTSLIQDNRFDGGDDADAVVYLDRSGDSLTFIGNTVTGTGIGVKSAPVGGAAQQIFAFNNITASGGAFYLQGSNQSKILYNQLEQSVDYAGDDDAQIVLDTCVGCDVIGNNLNGYDRVSNIKITGVGDNNRINANTMAIASGKSHVVLTATAGKLNVIGSQNRYLVGGAVGNTATVSDSSTVMQIGTWRKVTLQNSWGDASDDNYNEGLYVFRDEAGNVELRGMIASGTTTPGTLIASLPAGATPNGKYIRLPVMVNDGSAWSMGVLYLGPVGDLTIQAIAANNLLHFGGVRFNVAKAAA